MNEYDSLAMKSLLKREGYSSARSLEEADIVIFETCSVRQKAEDKVFGVLGRLAKKKRRQDKEYPILVVAGCMAERMKKDLIKRYPEVDLVIGPGHIHERGDKIKDIVEKKRGQISVSGFKGTIDDIYNEGLYENFSGVKAYVTVVRGCTNYCSYCIVPYVRGPERSRKIEEVLTEVNELAKKGVKEITLLGQNINIYGRDLKGGKIDFLSLLKEVAKIPLIKRVRFLTTHPKDTDIELVELMKTQKKLMPYLHMPFQSGSDKILEKMKRGYTRDEFLEKIKEFRKVYPELSFSTDVIVGYPGETEEDFSLTKEVLEKVRFDGAYLFKYSDRSGTKAEDEMEKVPQTVIKRRHKELLELQNKITFESNKNFVGSTVKILIEGTNKTDKSSLSGRTEHNKVAAIQKQDNVNIGDIVSAEVVRASPHGLYCY